MTESACYEDDKDLPFEADASSGSQASQHPPQFIPQTHPGKHIGLLLPYLRNHMMKTIVSSSLV